MKKSYLCRSYRTQIHDLKQIAKSYEHIKLEYFASSIFSSQQPPTVLLTDKLQ